MPGIFICYRREDASPYAGRLYDHLSARFGTQRVFMDIDTIRPGDDFVQVISERVAACEALICVIGRRWLTTADSRGRRRLEDPNDYVRIEIASALERNVRVIPVLVDGAQMPPARELPPDLAPLSRRNAVEITNTLFRPSVERLIQVLEQTVRPSPLSLHRAFKMRMPVFGKQLQPRPEQAAGTQSFAGGLQWQVVAAAAAFFCIHVFRYTLETNSQATRAIVGLVLQCGVIFGLLSVRGKAGSLDRKSVLRLVGCWVATVLFSYLAAAILFLPITSRYGATAPAAGAMSIVVQTAAAVVFGALVRLVRSTTSWRSVFSLARSWGLAAVVVWISGLLARDYTPPLLLIHLYQALVGGGILWLILQ